MNLYSVRIKHNDTGLVYRHRIVSQSLSDALARASESTLYTVIDAKLIANNI